MKTFRKTVRVIIVRDGTVCLSYSPKPANVTLYKFPGGGIEVGQSKEDACITECLEEVGIRISKPRSLGLVYKIRHSLKCKQRALLYHGTESEYFVADYVENDNILYNTKGDGDLHTWVPIAKAIRVIMGNLPGDKFNAARIEALETLQKQLEEACV